MEDNQPSGQNNPAINRSNSLDKLCFVRYGGGIAAYKTEFKRELLDFLGSLDSSQITYQTIHYWFENNSKPSKHNAMRFLLDYLNENVDYQTLSDDQKKVHTQLISFYRKKISATIVAPNLKDMNVNSELPTTGVDEINERVYFSPTGRVIINIPRSYENGIVIALSLVGVYCTYRYRFSENDEKPITQEVLRIFRRNKDLLYEHWHLRDGAEFAKFSGVVTLIGNILWFIGASHTPPERLRTMHFRYTNTSNNKYNSYRWGIVSGAISTPGSPDPASCRIVIVKKPSINIGYTKFARDNVKFMSEDELDEEIKKVIPRLIDNRMTAMSNPQSTTLAVTANGSWVQDSVLKVNQVTFDAALKILPEI